MNDSTVSCLCVTEGRPAFVPWLLWCFDRQTWSRRELVIIDSSPKPLQIGARDDVQVMTMPQGTGIARKRNLALQEARGEIITWFDDDDWQHPDKLAWLVEALCDGVPYAGSCHGWFVDLMELSCTAYRRPKLQIVFNSAGFRRQAVLPFHFPENVQHASDSRWMQDLARRYGDELVILEREVMFFWLCHDENLSNPARRRRFSKPLEVIKKLVGTEAWGETDDALDALRSRLQNQDQSGTADPGHERTTVISVPPTRGAQPQYESNGDESDKLIEVEPTPVGVMIKATVMDAPFSTSWCGTWFPRRAIPSQSGQSW